MAILASLPIIFSLLFIIFQSSNATKNSCPDQFTCGSLKKAIRYPLTRSSRPDCGFLMVECDAKPHPRLKYGGDRYDVKWVDDFSIGLDDQILSNLLRNKSCLSFYRNLSSFSSTPSITYRVFPDITLYRCENKQDNKTAHLFQGYKNHSCEGFRVYYRIPEANATDKNLLSHCSVFKLPSQLEKEPNVSGLFPMLASEFSLSWTLTEKCSECRYKLGGQCVDDRKTNRFNCSVSNSTYQNGTNANDQRSSSSSPWKWIIATAGSVGFCLLGIIIVLWFLKKRTNCLSGKVSRNASSDAMVDRDSEMESNYFGAPMFSYSELQEATNNFDPSRELGEGAFGTVYHGKLKDGREVAVKRLYEFNRKRLELFINEVEILSRLRHPNLVTLYGCTSRHNHGLLVYEYISNGTLADHLHGHRAKEGLLTWQTRMSISVETAGALAYLHASDVIHRDIKTNNILLDDNFRVKVADFGISRLFPENVTHVSTAPQGTPGYLDPEYHECYQLTDKSDVYSFGVVLIELVSSMPAVDMNRHRHEINLANFAIVKILRGEFRELVDPSLGVETDDNVLEMTNAVAELAFQCLQPEKDMRPTIDEVLATLIEIQKGEFNDC